MVLVDTSVWIAHFRAPNRQLEELLLEGQVLNHPAVTGELASGSIRNRNRNNFLGNLKRLSVASQPTTDEVLELIERRNLWGKGLGYVDVQLLASALIHPATLLTLDRRLFSAAARLGCAAKV